jgi:uncharacterized protein (DUF58 family)
MAVELSAFERSPRFSRWLDRRIPPSRSLTLSQESIFIFPTITGFLFGGLIVLLILGAINYQNSLVYGVAFTLGSLFLVTILYTFRNLSGLTIELIASGTGFVGEDVEFQVRISRAKGKGREGVQLGWLGAIAQWAELYDSEACTVRLFVPAATRGWLDPGRLLIETLYPLGLLRAWTWVDLGARALVYPQPLFIDQPDQIARRGEDGELMDPQGSDDFSDMRLYRPGDPVRHVIWRAYARTDQLIVKEYTSYLDPRLMLDYDRVAGGTEERLSRLTGMALNAARSGREFGLVLPGTKIRPGIGDPHRDSILRALALYGLPQA